MVRDRIYDKRQDVLADVFDYIKLPYNRKRRLSNVAIPSSVKYLHRQSAGPAVV